MDESDNESFPQDSASEFEYEETQDVEIDSDGGEASDDQMVIEPPEVRKAPYVLMNRAALETSQMRCITEASELLDLTQEESFVLLREHGWDLARLQEAWFSNEAKVRETCGISPASGPSASSSSSSAAMATGPSGKCPICLQVCEGMRSLGCGHYFCEECWRGYMHNQVNDGKAAVHARCPQHKCRLVVPAQLFMCLCDEARQNKYKEWYLRTYVDDNPSVKWCTNPAGCLGPYACEYQGVDPLEISCNCGFKWCWACGEESHRPADCTTVNQWSIKNSAESENISWIRANTKKCPKCHKPIEKNQGCNHMICSKAGGCGHEFCWLCLGEWSTHGTSTGGYYQCNIYDKQAKEGRHTEEEKTRQRAKHALDKYMFYFERFMDHDRGMKLTVREEQDVEGKVKTLHDTHGFEIIELQFLYDALRQVRACRRVLKWTYVFGYYMEESGPEKNLFEHLQKNLEEKTDNLHEMLEKDFNQFFEEPSTSTAKDKFMEFRSHVTNFTNVTTKFLQQVLMDLGVGGGLTGSASPREGKAASSI
jgi:ariadne-1